MLEDPDLHYFSNRPFVRLASAVFHIVHSINYFSFRLQCFLCLETYILRCFTLWYVDSIMFIFKTDTNFR
jgi:hypothetical protein